MPVSSLRMRRFPSRSRAAQSDRPPGEFEREAAEIHAVLRARHLPFGTILDPIFSAPDSDTIVAYTRSGDSAIWTGHYLATEALRYAVTRATDAFENAAAAAGAIHELVEVTGTNLLARARIPDDSPFAAGIQSEEAPNGVYSAQIKGRGYHWVANTSRDQYLGVFFGLSVAYEAIHDTGLRDLIRDTVTRMLDFLIRNGWNIVQPDGSVNTTFLQRPDQVLSLLQVGRQVNPQRFDAIYRNERFWNSVRVIIPIGFDVLDEHSSYFKFNLDVIALFNLIRLEEEGIHRNRYVDAYGSLRRTIDGHGNAHFNMIDRALHGPNAARDAETIDLLDAWLRRQLVRLLRGTCAASFPACPRQSCLRADSCRTRACSATFSGSAARFNFLVAATASSRIPAWISYSPTGWGEPTAYCEVAAPQKRTKKKVAPAVFASLGCTIPGCSGGMWRQRGYPPALR